MQEHYPNNSLYLINVDEYGNYIDITILNLHDFDNDLSFSITKNINVSGYFFLNSNTFIIDMDPDRVNRLKYKPHMEVYPALYKKSLIILRQNRLDELI